MNVEVRFSRRPVEGNFDEGDRGKSYLEENLVLTSPQGVGLVCQVINTKDLHLRVNLTRYLDEILTSMVLRS